MIDTNVTKPTVKLSAKEELAAKTKASRRAEQAQIVGGLQGALEKGEQLLAFSRGRIAGGWRGKLNVGPEAFFAPVVNIGLTERRLILQHIHPENGKPSEMQPHYFVLEDIASLSFTDIETFGGEPAARLIVRQGASLFIRLRLLGATNFDSGKALAEVFGTLVSALRAPSASPTQRVCPQCARLLDQPSRFCPYCGAAQPQSAPPATVIITDVSPAAFIEHGGRAETAAETGGTAGAVGIQQTVETLSPHPGFEQRWKEATAADSEAAQAVQPYAAPSSWVTTGENSDAGLEEVPAEAPQPYADAYLPPTDSAAPANSEPGSAKEDQYNVDQYKVEHKWEWNGAAKTDPDENSTKNPTEYPVRNPEQNSAESQSGNLPAEATKKTDENEPRVDSNRGDFNI